MDLEVKRVEFRKQKGKIAKTESKGGEKMRKVALLLVIPIIAVILSSCTFVGTRVKDSYIQHEYIDKVKVAKKYKVGTKEIKFYVDKAVDSRKTKHVWRKPLYSMPVGAPIKIDNITKTLREATEKALVNTGWNITENKELSDYTIDLNLKRLNLSLSAIGGWWHSNVMVCIKRDNMPILEKDVKREEWTLGGRFLNLDLSFKGFAGQAARTFYKSLLKYFSSPEFVNAIKEDYYNTHSVKQERAE